MDVAVDTSVAADSAAPPVAPVIPQKAIKKRKDVILESEMDEQTELAAAQDAESLFHAAGLLSDTIWKSNTPNAVSQQWILPGFSYSHKQTVALRLTVPTNASSWSLNISPARDWDNCNILLHFNPRYKKRCLVMTDKQGTWAPATTKHFTSSSSSKTDGLLSKEVDLMIQLRPEGFVVFANNMYNCFFPHRRDPTTTSTSSVAASSSFDSRGRSTGAVTDLKLTVNARDANGNQLDIILHKVGGAKF